MIHGRTVDLLRVNKPSPRTVEHFDEVFVELGEPDVLGDIELYLFLVLWAEEF
jgi:hypothetical protein